MDGLTIGRLASELHEQLSGGKIEKIYQPATRDLVLLVRSPGRGSFRLLLSAHKQFARAHLLDGERPENPKEPPMFCMLLRKYIEGGRITSIEQYGRDRILHVVIEAYDEVGDLTKYALICELMGRHSNVALCRRGSPETDSDDVLRIIDAIVRVTESMSRFREVLPGAPYELPPAQSKKMPEDIVENDLHGIDISSWSSRNNVTTLVDKVFGIGPTTAREVLHRASLQSQRQPSAHPLSLVAEAMTAVAAVVKTASESTSVSLDDMGRAMECAPFLLTHKHNYALCPSMSEAIRRRFADTGEVLYHSHLQDELNRIVAEHIDRLRGKRIKLEESLTNSEDEAEYRVKAELLTAFAYQIDKGMQRIVLDNYYDDNRPIAIELNPALDAIGNAQRYYKQAAKRKRAARSVVEQLESTNMDLTYLENVQESLRDAALENLEQIRRELISEQFMSDSSKSKKKRSGSPQKKSRAESSPEAFISSDNLLILVGRNNLQNDRLTFRQSAGDDIWLHVKDQPGSHVVIRRGHRNEVPQTTLEEAAILAAYYSRGRDSANVPVDITEIRHVWKPNGSRPGFALYDHQNTVYVTPDRSLLEPLLARKDVSKS